MAEPVSELPPADERPWLSWPRYGLLFAVSAVGFFASVGAAATRLQSVARAWNSFSPLANPGLSIGRRKYMLHAPHRVGAPRHQGSWHWEAHLGPLPLWHRRKFRVWQRFF